MHISQKIFHNTAKEEGYKQRPYIFISFQFLNVIQNLLVKFLEKTSILKNFKYGRKRDIQLHIRIKGRDFFFW